MRFLSHSLKKSIAYGAFASLLAMSTVAPSYADIYSYTDSNGVRHISNRPNDARYKLVMRTPTYKKPVERARPRAQAPRSDVSSLQLGNGGGWKVLQPSSDRRSALAKLPANATIQWGGSSTGKRGKPFKINEKTRQQLSREIARIAAQQGLDPHLIHAVISAESAFNPRAVSHAGATGLMQLMPATAERFGVKNPLDPVDNIRGGARYLRWLLKHFKNNLPLALAGYNAGENAVKKYGYQIPPYKETQTYVGRVMRFYSHFRSGRS